MILVLFYLLFVEKRLVLIPYLMSQESFSTSTLAQGKRAGPITLRSVDRNYEVLIFIFMEIIKRVLGFHKTPPVLVEACLYELECVVHDVSPPKGMRVSIDFSTFLSLVK